MLFHGFVDVLLLGGGVSTRSSAQLGKYRSDQSTVIFRQGRQRAGLVLRAGLLLIDAPQQTPVAGASDLDLVHPNDRVEGENPPTGKWAGGGGTGFGSMGGDDLANWPGHTGAECGQPRGLDESSSVHGEHRFLFRQLQTRRTDGDVASVNLIFQRLERLLSDPDDHRFRAVGVPNDPLPEIRAGNLDMAADLQAGGRGSAP